MPSTTELIKELREKTGAGIMECKRAVEDAVGDLVKAEQLIKERGLAMAEKKKDREAGQGLIESYVHAGRIGAMIELNCETDFVARTDDFRELVRSLAMQVAATNAQSVDRAGVDPVLIERERAILLEQAKTSGKPEAILQKIVDGKIEKFYEEICLLEQPTIRDPDRKVKDLLDAAIAKLGENIVVRRFVRFRIGDA